MFTGILGHKKQIQFLEKSVETGKLAHAYLFAGPSFVGKKTVAKCFANALLGEKNEGQGVGFHPDLIEIGLRDTVKIEEVRDLIYKLSLKPYQSQYKIAVIDNAENMTIEAQNALLKVLEEPKEYTVIILITANPGKILRTISSRTQKITFGPVESSEFAQMIPQGLETLVSGRPGLARALSNDSELLAAMNRTLENLSIVQSQELPEKLKLAADLAELETADLRRELELWLIGYEDAFRKSSSTKSAQNIRSINYSRKLLDQNANTKLLFTNLMLTLT